MFHLKSYAYSKQTCMPKIVIQNMIPKYQSNLNDYSSLTFFFDFSWTKAVKKVRGFKYLMINWWGPNQSTKNYKWSRVRGGEFVFGRIRGFLVLGLQDKKFTQLKIVQTRHVAYQTKANCLSFSFL